MYRKAEVGSTLSGLSLVVCSDRPVVLGGMPPEMRLYLEANVNGTWEIQADLTDVLDELPPDQQVGAFGAIQVRGFERFKSHNEAVYRFSLGSEGHRSVSSDEAETYALAPAVEKDEVDCRPLDG